MILFNFREELEKMKNGPFEGSAYIQPLGMPSPTIAVVDDDDVKAIKVSQRTTREDGVAILISSLTKHCDLQAGDRLTITGRVGSGAPDSSWGMVLRRGSPDWKQLTHQITPMGLFSLTHLLEAVDLDVVFWLQTNHWGETSPTMDFFIDSILITRMQTKIIADERDIIYTLSNDDFFQSFNEKIVITLAEKDEINNNEMCLRRSGNPVITVCKGNNENIIHISRRTQNWDGLDIMLQPFELLQGNKYQLQVTGRIDGSAPPKSVIMLQGVPTYTWEHLIEVKSNDSFILKHNISPDDLEKWIAIRIATNIPGTDMSFFIDSIELCVM
ncbi:MAG: hypothetical protein FWC91_04130 [Defluviitaleaceae bacterium]|nr:hypothetical protein [Defluviitaleaceae bacterium]